MMQSDAQTPSPSPAFLQALRHVLRPLVHLMVARGITLPYIVELLKSLMVEVADKDFTIGNKPSTDSRVSLLTGVHRKDVNRLRHSENHEDDKINLKVSLGAQLVAQWLGNPMYLDELDQARPLPRHASEGGDQSFEALVASVNSDIRSRVVLDEWLRLAVVSLDDQRRVCLNTQAFVPTKGFDEKAFYFGHNLHDHAAAAAHNLLGEEPPFLERSVHYRALSAESVQILEAQSKKLGMQALLAINKTAMEREQLDALQGTVLHRMTFGIYFYAEPCQSDPVNTEAPESKQDALKP